MDIISIIGYALSPFSILLTWLLSRKQSAKEVERLKEEINGMQKQNTGVDIANIRAATEILTENVVKPLEKELHAVRRELFRFRRAVEKVNACKYEDECPVKKELNKQDENEKTDN
jgi:hypothetical protein